jgi:hypothetical protein
MQFHAFFIWKLHVQSTQLAADWIRNSWAVTSPLECTIVHGTFLNITFTAVPFQLIAT